MTRPVEIHGLVDNATPQHLYGWAWNAAKPEERVTIELRLGDQVMATAIAEQERPDLAPAGIGDGRHAFALPLQPDWLQRRGELAVVARAADGTEAPLAIRVRRAEQDPESALQRMMEAVARSHRELRQELDRLARRLPPEAPRLDEQLAAVADGQAMLAARLDTLALWLTRLDERSAATPIPVSPPARPRRLDLWQLVLGAVLGTVIIGAGVATVSLLRGQG